MKSNDASITGSFAWKGIVSYDEARYKIVLEILTDKKLNWKVGFQSFSYPRWGIYNQNARALYNREPIQNWSSNFITLLGDVAHVILHNQGQGADIAIEDAGHRLKLYEKLIQFRKHCKTMSQKESQ
ncbi:leukocidin family pore-forming toxin [Bacillus sp. TH13]|nr:leukocidin family pore-forming toxin [Bacillus sp. TH13]